MKLVNLWKGYRENVIYEMPTDWLPQYDGWHLVGTEWVPDNSIGFRYI